MRAPCRLHLVRGGWFSSYHAALTPVDTNRRRAPIHYSRRNDSLDPIAPTKSLISGPRPTAARPSAAGERRPWATGTHAGAAAAVHARRLHARAGSHAKSRSPFSALYLYAPAKLWFESDQAYNQLSAARNPSTSSFTAKRTRCMAATRTGIQHEAASVSGPHA